MTNEVEVVNLDDFDCDDELIQDLFDGVMKDYELDATMSLEDVLYEMFYLGFEAGENLLLDEAGIEKE